MYLLEVACYQARFYHSYYILLVFISRNKRPQHIHVVVNCNAKPSADRQHARQLIARRFLWQACSPFVSMAMVGQFTSRWSAAVPETCRSAFYAIGHLRSRYPKQTIPRHHTAHVVANTMNILIVTLTCKKGNIKGEIIGFIAGNVKATAQ